MAENLPQQRSINLGTEEGILSVLRDEAIAAENIAVDQALADTLNFTPISVQAVILFLNGVRQTQGVGADYTMGGANNRTITWLAATGTAVDMLVTDSVDVNYGTDA